MRFTLCSWRNFAIVIYLTEYRRHISTNASTIPHANYDISRIDLVDRGWQAKVFHSASGVFNEDVVGADEEDANSRGTKYSLACVGVESMSIKSVND